MSTTDEQRPAETFLVDVGDFFANRPSQPNRLYRIGNKSLAMATTASAQPYVDRSNMSARAVISTATIDRVGDVLVPKGCNTENYAKNPVVLWGHGIEGLAIPVGTSRDKGGKLAIEVTETEVIGTCYFSETLLESRQIFELIDEGIVRATSVRETPIKSRMVMSSGEQVLLVDEWELEEWSWCAVGVNPDAVAKAIHKNKIDGKPIVESILKSLNAVAPPKQILGKGFTEIKAMAKEDMETPADEARESNDAGQQPYGAQALAAFHHGISSQVKCAEKCMGAMEHPKATPGLRKAIDTVKDVATELKGIHAECYPNHVLKDDMAEDESMDSDSEMKAFLASGQRYQWQIGGVSASLKAMATEKNLTPAQRKDLIELAGGIDRLTTQAKSFRPTPAEPEKKPDVSAEAQAKLEEVFAKLTQS